MIRSSETIVPPKKIIGNLEIAQKIRTSDVQPWLNFSKWVAWGMAVFTASNPIPRKKYSLTTTCLVLEHIGTVFGGCGDIPKKNPLTGHAWPAKAATATTAVVASNSSRSQEIWSCARGASVRESHLQDVLSRVFSHLVSGMSLQAQKRARSRWSLRFAAVCYMLLYSGGWVNEGKQEDGGIYCCVCLST